MIRETSRLKNQRLFPFTVTLLKYYHHLKPTIEWSNPLVLKHMWRRLCVSVTTYFFPPHLLASDLPHLVTHQHQRICSHSSDSDGRLLSAVADLLCAARSPYFIPWSHFPRNSSCCWKFFCLWLARQSVGAVPSRHGINRISLTSPSTSQSRAAKLTYVWPLLESTR